MINRVTNRKYYTDSRVWYRIWCQVPRMICSNSFSCGVDTGCYILYREIKRETWSWCIFDETSSAMCWHVVKIFYSLHKAQTFFPVQTM